MRPVKIYEIGGHKIDLNRLVAIGPVSELNTIEWIVPFALEFNTTIVVGFEITKWDKIEYEPDGVYRKIKNADQYVAYIKQEIAKLEEAWVIKKVEEPQISVSQAVRKLTSELKSDSQFYESYHSSIACAYLEVITEKNGKALKKDIEIANDGATRFLKWFLDK